jgi:hypothetical protein
MQQFNLKNFVKWWFIGDFIPTLLNTKDFEIAIKYYITWDHESAHYHAIAQEFTIVTSGVFQMNKKELRKNDIILLSPWEVAEFECIKDGTTIVIKTPSVKNDKYIA